MNNITESLVPLTNFKNIHSENGKYISSAIFAKKNVTKRLKIQSSLLVSNKKKQKWNNVLKKIHEFRINNLNSIQNNECIKIIDKLKNIKVISNRDLQVQVDSGEELDKDLNNLLKIYTDEDIDEIIKQEFAGSESEIKNKDYLIDKDKLQKIAENDFAIAIKKIISKVEMPKEVKYLNDFLKKLKETNEINLETINKLQKTLNNKTTNIITELLSIENDNPKKTLPKKTLEDFHVLISICNSQNITISESKEKKILKLCLKSFNTISSELNTNSNDIAIIKGQLEDLKEFKNTVVNPIIRHTSNNADKEIEKITKMVSFVEKWTNLVVDKHNNLIKELQTNTKNALDKSDEISILITTINDLSLKRQLISEKLQKEERSVDKLSEGKLSKELKQAMLATKDDINKKHKQALLELTNKCNIFYNLLDDNQDKRSELQQHLERFKNIPQEEQIIPEHDSNLIEKHLQQQINDKISNLPKNEEFTNLVNNTKEALEVKYSKLMSLMLINSMLKRINASENLVKVFQDKNERLNNNSELNLSTINEKFFKNTDTLSSENTQVVADVPENKPEQIQAQQTSTVVNTAKPIPPARSRSVSSAPAKAPSGRPLPAVPPAPPPPPAPSAPSAPSAPPPPPVAIPIKKPSISNDRLEASTAHETDNRKNLLDDIRNADNINRLKKVSENSTAKNNKSVNSTTNDNFLEDSLAFRKARINPEENNPSGSNPDDEEWV